ncbi:Zinc finger protein 84 [Folsomia candida]|uniref:Zinc finger protein 84 n=1 Tax=Folsomia candida TaxID=158441 RepID=A0A226DKJ6_FOLCA|nr:Zinc finger protein 84 [Folsomia candida]
MERGGETLSRPYGPGAFTSRKRAERRKVKKAERPLKIVEEPETQGKFEEGFASGRISEQNETDGMEVNKTQRKLVGGQKALVPTMEKIDKGLRFQENRRFSPTSVQPARDDNHAQSLATNDRLSKTKKEREQSSLFHEKCPHCEKVFFTRHHFTDHVNAHEGRKNHACPICKKKFTTKGHLTAHLFVHLSGEERAEVAQGWRHGCYFCSKRFKKPFDLSRHLVVHTKEKLGGRCRICRKTFSSKRALTSHRFLHLSEDEKVTLVKQGPSRECLFCQKKFPDNRTYHRHLVSHTKEKPFPCDQCGALFGLKSNLTMHAPIHSADPRPFKCTECGHAFTQKANLVTHKKTVHWRLKNFACPDCAKKFGTKGAMVQHLKGVHAKIRHPCPHCGKPILGYI